jgi:hypothetical protein
MKECCVCGQLTESAVGAAGIKWKNICQECKDREDKELAKQVSLTKRVIDKIVGLVR